MDFIANREPHIQEMMAAIGISHLDELFEAIPAQLKIPRPQEDDGLSEYEGIKLMEALAAKNRFADFDNYLGSGAYEHHIPSLVGAICSKSEFLTSYTPYQAEASQGTLQAMFEFQSSICALTGLDIANTSVYDGATACAEAIRMALRLSPGRKKIYVTSSLHPHYQAVIGQYLIGQEVKLETIPFHENGLMNVTAIKSGLTEEVAALLVQSPNFFGLIEEEIPMLFSLAKSKGVLTVLCANPLSYGLLPSAFELGSDIAVGDTQPFGIPLQFGGPYVGYMACLQRFVRQMPGRIVGQTVDGQGRKGYVLTLQAREQHIRREKATSNICTSQALSALASLVAMAWYGKEGIRQLALTNYQRAHYLQEELSKIKGIEVLRGAPFFNEFVIRFSHPIEKIQDHFRKNKIEPGFALERYFPSFVNCLLVAVTETKCEEQLHRYIQAAKTIN